MMPPFLFSFILLVVYITILIGLGSYLYSYSKEYSRSRSYPILILRFFAWVYCIAGNLIFFFSFAFGPPFHIFNSFFSISILIMAYLAFMISVGLIFIVAELAELLISLLRQKTETKEQTT